MLFFATSKYIKCIKTSFKQCLKCSCEVCPKCHKCLSCFYLDSGRVLSPSVAVIADMGGGCVLFRILKLWGALLIPLADHIDLALKFPAWSAEHSNLDFRGLVGFVRRTHFWTPILNEFLDLLPRSQSSWLSPSCCGGIAELTALDLHSSFLGTS